APLLYLLGIVAILWTKRNVWALLVHLAMLACLVDVEVTGTLERVWTATYPWSTVDRLLSMQFFVLPLIMAQGVVWATHQVVSWPLWTVGRRLLAGIALASTATAVTAGSGIILITGQYDGEVRS